MRFTPYQQKIAKWLIATAVIAMLGFFGIQYPKASDMPPFPPVGGTEGGAVQLGTTNFDALSLSGDLTVGGDAITFDSEAFAKTSAITITGVLTDVILIYSQQ